MLQLNTIKELHHWRTDKHLLALVPTMGNLHAGHLKLIEEAKKQAKFVLISIFVNPTQFGENEDFATYPRTLKEDFAKAESQGADALFCPDVLEIYPEKKPAIWIHPGPLAEKYCGQSRPIHFKGVATIVAKLFNLVQPEWAVFGKKDYQQLTIIQQMVKELNFPVKILAVEIQRENSGLALSSRNQYLSKTEKEKAPQLWQELSYIRQKIIAGEKNFKLLTQTATQRLTQTGWLVEYIEIARQNDLESASPQDKELIVLAAAKLGTTRLIDNIELNLNKTLL